MSGNKGRKTIVWLILDAAGYQITTRCIQAGVCPSLATIRDQGYLGVSRPPGPNCETPPALRALFSGSAPPQSGIWGYRMPDYRRKLERAVSGFEVPIAGAPAIWEELEQRGGSYTLINAAFRKDPAWGRDHSGFDLLLDGYRGLRSDCGWIRMNAGAKQERLSLAGARLRVESAGGRARVLRGRGCLASLAPGEIRPLKLSRSASAVAYSTGRCLFLCPSSRPHLRMAKNIREESGWLIPESVYHGSLFRYSREQGGLSVDEEMKLSEYVTAQMGQLAVSVVRELSSSLTIAYFSLIDELGHVYLDQIEALWPDGRAAELLRRCYRLLDSYIGKIMEQLEGDSLLVLSADHGQAPYRRVLHINELLAETGLVRRCPRGAKQSGAERGYDLGRSAAYYHPSNCGQVVVNPVQARRAGLSRRRIAERVIDCLEQANTSLESRIAYLEGGDTDPYLLFLYPLADTHLSGRPHPRAAILDESRKGGQHLSPLQPTPWIQAMLALWSPSGLPLDRKIIPRQNTDVKDFLLPYLLEA
ncbi:MAG: alkaline phosphatase family protein [Spirochaetales bacterium]|nr:alkaline phosphatase family protein [Spirochaetales bacterium]